MSLGGFKVYIPTTGDANLTLTKNGIGISKATVSKLWAVVNMSRS